MSFFKTLFGGGKSQADDSKDTVKRDFDVLKYDGVRALRSGHADYAVQCLEHALEINGDLECRDYLSQAYISTGNLAEAYRQLACMAEARPDNAPIVLRMADVAYMMEDYDAMAEACAKALTIDDSEPLAYYLSARAAHGRADNETAVAMLNKALQLADDYHAARLLRGEIRLADNLVAEAAEDAARLLADVEGNEDVLLLNARVAEAGGDHDKALNMYGAVIDADPFCMAAYSERGAVRAALGDAQGAADDEAMAADLSASASAVQENVEQKVKQTYKNIDPYGIFNNG